MHHGTVDGEGAGASGDAVGAGADGSCCCVVFSGTSSRSISSLLTEEDDRLVVLLSSPSDFESSADEFKFKDIW